MLVIGIVLSRLTINFFPLKIIISIQIFYKWNFMLKNHLYQARGWEGVRIGWEETTSKNIIKKILTHVYIYIYIYIYIHKLYVKLLCESCIYLFPYPNKPLSIPHGPNKSPRHIICPIRHFLVPNGAYDQEGDFLPSPRWIKCTIPAWPMGRMLMLC
jgi:hypothetical protein